MIYLKPMVAGIKEMKNSNNSNTTRSITKMDIKLTKKKSTQTIAPLFASEYFKSGGILKQKNSIQSDSPVMPSPLTPQNQVSKEIKQLSSFARGGTFKSPLPKSNFNNFNTTNQDTKLDGFGSALKVKKGESFKFIGMSVEYSQVSEEKRSSNGSVLDEYLECDQPSELNASSTLRRPVKNSYLTISETAEMASTWGESENVEE